MSTWTARAKAPGTDIRGLTSTALGNVKRRNACPAPSAATALRRLAAALSLSFRRSPSGVRDRSSDPTPSDSRRRPRGELDFPFFLRAFAGPRSPAQAPLNGRSSCSASPLRRSSERRSHRACGGRLATGRTAAGLLLAGAVLLAAPVLPGAGGAVRAEVLVSNIGLGAESANIAAIDYDYAQAFTTGSNSQGYTLTSVEIGIETTETPTASLSIHRSTSNAPGSVVGTLTSPGTLIQGINTFTHSGLSLAPNTTYFVVIGFQNVTATNTTLEYTRSNSESGATGWSIGDNSHGRPGDNWAEFRNSMQIRVSGRANSPIATITAGTSPVTEGTAATFTVTLAAAAPDGGVTVNLRVSESDGSDYVAPGDEGSKTLAIAAGQTSGTYRVATVDDGDDEPNGSVTVTLASGTGYTLGSPTSASVTVRDNDEDLEPSFGDSSIANQSYTENVRIADLTLPAATGGNGTLRYSLSPTPPAGLSFNAGSRRLTGAPSGTQNATTYTYSATDTDGDTVTLTFSIAVAAAPPGAAPSFGASSIPDQSYRQNQGIAALTLPAATGGNGTLRYSLSPSPPAGLSFNAATRRLTGTPSGTQDATTYTYTVTDADGDTATLAFTIAIEEFSTDIEVPDDLPAELRRVPRSVAVSATGVVTWNLDSNTDADPGTDYLVMWIWDEQPPSRMKLANPFADYATRMERECSGGRCELRIEGFDAGRHYLVHVTTGARFGDRLPAVAVRYTPAPGEALDLTGLPKEVVISGAGLVTWRAASVQVEYYSVAWASGDSRLERSRSRGARGRDYRIVEVDTCADGRCQFQIPNFDAERHWVAEVNSYEREQAAREPVRARYAPGAVDLPAVSVADARVTEADGVTLEFTATLDRAAAADATVDYATADGTARAGEDYTATSGTLTFAAGETSKTIRVPVLDDAYDEGEETLSLTLSNPAGLRIADGEATGTIVNTDPLPLPESGALFTVYHDPDHSAAAVSRHDTAVGLLDQAGWPYVVRTVAGTGKVDRLAGVTGTVMPRFFLGDPEDSEWGPAQAKVNNGGLKWLRSVLARLKESPPPAAPTPSLSIAGGSAVAEGTAAAFTVTLSEAAPEGGLTLAYGVSEDGDFVAAADEGAKTVAIPAGATSTPISVPTAADDDDEADGTVTVTLTAGTGYTLGSPSSAAVTVRDDDAPVAAPQPSTAAFTIYHDAGDSAAVARYNTAVTLLDAAGQSYTVRRVTGTSEVDRLAGVSGSVMPRFFEGDPAAGGWGPSQPGVNNGGLRWLRSKLPQDPSVSVADARVQEAGGATLDFAVTLDRAAASTATVAYATADGTATAGTDYTATSGTLTFAAGETRKTVSVAVLDDAHDEGSETLTLTLSNASGLRIADGTATGTIENTDTMPQAWTARFGRSVATHVLGALDERLHAASSGSWVQLAGRRLDGEADLRGRVQRLVPDRDLWADELASDPSQAMTFRELLLGSAFHLASNDEDTGSGARLSAWGRVAASGFDGQSGRVSLDGTVTTATLGVDGAWDRLLSGVLVAYSEGDGSYTHAGLSGGELSSSLTSVHPYAAYSLSERVRLWGMVGYGSGALQLRLEEEGGAMDTDLTMTMGALGVRGRLLDPAQAGGLELALRSDVLWMVMDSAAADNLAATEAKASRLRLVLEGSRPVALEDGGTFTPSLELGLRHDGGDAETGSGLEVGGSLAYASSWGLSIEASVRALLAHEAEDYTEWGAGGALRFDPGRRGRGLTASIAPAWGTASGGVQSLWGQAGVNGQSLVDPLATAAGRLDAELGYGLAALSGRGLLTPYARVALTEGADQAWHLGTRLELAEILNLSLEAGRRSREGERAAHEVALLAKLGW